MAAVARAKAALDGLKNSGGDIRIGAEINASQIAKAAAETRALDRALGATATGGGRRWTGWLATAHMVLTVFGANIAADLIGIIAFGIGATAAFVPVIQAVQNLGQTYGYLNPLQKNATVQITNFMHSFQAANQTGIFATFTDLLDGVRNSVGKTGGVLDQAQHAFQNFAGLLRSDFSSPAWAQLFSRSSGIIEKDLNALFRFINAIIQVIPALFHDFNSLGLWVLNSTSLFLHLVAALGNSHAGLVRFAAGVFLVYRALKMLGQFNQGSLLMRGLTAGLASFRAEGSLAADTMNSIKTYGLGTTAFLLTGFTPAMLGAGAAILGAAAAGIGLGIWLNRYKGQANDMVSILTQQDHAVGDNIAGYQKLSDQLKANISQGSQYVGASRQLQGVLNEQTQAQQHAAQTAQTLRGNLNYLEQTYHLTQQQAFQLAKATGTNLFSAFQKGGGAAQAVRNKIQAYEQTVRAARNPTSTLGYDLGLAANKALQLDDRVTALTNAFNALLTPFANVITDTVTWRDGNNQLKGAVDKAHGSVNDMGNRLQRLAAGDLATAIQNTVKLSQDTLQSTGSYAKAMQAIRREIGVLKSLHSKSSEVTTAIQYLQKYLDALHSKSITITTHFLQVGAAPGTAYSGSGVGHATAPSGYASGTANAAPGWAMVGERGPELMYMRGGETVIPNHALGNIKGYANGTADAVTAQPINIYLDGQVIYKSVERRVYGKNMQNGVRNQHGGAEGRFGVR